MNIDNITTKVRKFSKDTVAEVQKMNEVRQLNSNISAEKKKIHSMYTEMGKKLYDRYRENPPEEFEAEFTALKGEFESIELLREQVRAVKGVTLCPNCKMEVGMQERFCSNCGCKMPEVISIEEEEPAGALETDASAVQTDAEDSSTTEAEAAEENAELETEAAEESVKPEAETVEETAATEQEAPEESAEPEAETAEENAEPETEAAEESVKPEAETAEESAEPEAEAAEESAEPEAEAAETKDVTGDDAYN